MCSPALHPIPKCLCALALPFFTSQQFLKSRRKHTGGQIFSGFLSVVTHFLTEKLPEFPETGSENLHLIQSIFVYYCSLSCYFHFCYLCGDKARPQKFNCSHWGWQHRIQVNVLPEIDTPSIPAALLGGGTPFPPPCISYIMEALYRTSRYNCSIFTILPQKNRTKVLCGPSVSSSFRCLVEGNHSTTRDWSLQYTSEVGFTGHQLPMFMPMWTTHALHSTMDKLKKNYDTRKHGRRSLEE